MFRSGPNSLAGPVYSAATAAVAWPSFAAFPSVYPSAALSASLS